MQQREWTCSNHSVAPAARAIRGGLEHGLAHFDSEPRELAEDQAGEIGQVDDREIGGVDADCREINDGISTGVACVSQENGLPLLSDSVLEGGKIQMEVRRVQRGRGRLHLRTAIPGG